MRSEATYDGCKVEVARTPEEKQTQRSFFFWYKPEMRQFLRGTLTKLGLKKIAPRLLDEPQKTTDVTPSPHITPCCKGRGKNALGGHDLNKAPGPPGFFRKRDRGK